KTLYFSSASKQRRLLMLLDQERINSVFQKVERQLAKIASKPQPDHVHQFRTSTRRIEALLQELVPKQDRNQRKLLKELSQLRRRAGRIRDVDVQVQALLSLKAPQEATLKAEVLRSLAEMREIGRASCRERVEATGGEGVMKEKYSECVRERG